METQSRNKIILIITIVVFVVLGGIELIKPGIFGQKLGEATKYISPCKLITDKNEKLDCLLNEAGLESLVLTPEEKILDSMFDRTAGVFGADVEIPLFKTIGVDDEGQPMNVVNDTVSLYMAKKVTQCAYLAQRYFDSDHNGGCPVIKVGWESDDDRSATIESINQFINDKL